MILFCDECGCESDERAVGWRGYLLESEDDEAGPKVCFFCRGCAVAEFGGRERDPFAPGG